LSSEEFGLTLRDRLDWPWLVLNNLRTITEIAKREVYDERIYKELVDIQEAIIPEKFRQIDETYQADIKKNTKEVTIDKRPKFGGIRLSEKLCAEMNIKPYETENQIPYIKKLDAIVSLLNRLGVIGKKDYVERVNMDWPEFKDDPTTTVQEV